MIAVGVAKPRASVDAIRCGVAAAEAVRSLGIEIRAGVSFGQLELVEGKAGGLIVNTAARVMSVAGPGEVLVPASVKDIVVGTGIVFADHGVHRLKGIEDETRLFLVTVVDGTPAAPEGCSYSDTASDLGCPQSGSDPSRSENPSERR